MNTTIRDVKYIDLKENIGNEGCLVAIEENNDIPINISRVFYVYGSDGKNRGNHAHVTTRQVLVCLNGSALVTCFDGEKYKTFILDRPDKGVFIPEMIWDSIDYACENTILLVLSSSPYDREDYIEDFDFFKNKKLETVN